MKRIITLSVILWVLCGVLAYTGFIGYKHGVAFHKVIEYAKTSAYGVDIPTKIEARQEQAKAAYIALLGGPIALGAVFQESGAFLYGQRWTFDVDELSALLEQETAERNKNRRDAVWHIFSGGQILAK